jgi:glycerophosphoryl diester phosphodiesterase
MSAELELQGHRGARGLKPENTLPGFEVAFDLGGTSVELDLHLTADGELLVYHDSHVSGRLCRPAPPEPLPIRGLSLAELRRYRADHNPDPQRFPHQDASVTPRAQRFAEQRGIDPYTPPTLGELLAFAAEFARSLRFDLELKRVPGRPELIGDDFDGKTAGLLERRVVEAIQAAGMLERTTVRSFDHRSVLAIKELEPRLTTAVLIAGTAPVDPVALVRTAGANVYCPSVDFLDEVQVQQCHAAGIRVVPWTVNEPSDWGRLLTWGVDGITTDFPDRLAELLRQRGVAIQ